MPRRSMAAFAAGMAGIAVGSALWLGSAAGLSFNSQPMTPYRTCTLAGTPATTSVVTDTTARQGSPNTNYGTAATMEVASGGGVNRRVYLRFDLASCSPSIPATATVRLATLRLYASGLPAACRTVDIFRVTASWTETGLTWSNQPFGTTINNPPAASRTDSFGAGTPVGCENRVTGYISGAVVTADVAAFVAGSASNFGWMLRDDAEGSGTTRTTTFSAKNLGTIDRVPELVITYVRVP